MFPDNNFFLLLLRSMLGLTGVYNLGLIKYLRYFLSILLHVLEALGIATYWRNWHIVTVRCLQARHKCLLIVYIRLIK